MKRGKISELKCKKKAVKMIEKMMRIALLYDFYGELLTDKQKSIMEMHYENDYTLAEIADELFISRQAVHDALKTCEKMLCEYEEKLGQVSKFEHTSDMLLKNNKILEDVIGKLSQESGDNIKIADIIDKLRKVSENNRKLTDNQ